MKIVIVAVSAVALIALGGCAKGMKGSARRTCYDAGYRPGTPEFSSCWKGIRDQQFAGELPIILGVAGAVAATNPPKNVQALPPDEPKPQRVCVYYTDKGKRTMLPVNNVCPPHYGD